MKKGFVMNTFRWVVRHDLPLPFAVCVYRCDNVKPCSSNYCCQHGVTCMYETSRPPFSVLSQIFCLRYSSHSCTTLMSRCNYSLVTSIHALHLFIRYIYSCVVFIHALHSFMRREAVSTTFRKFSNSKLLFNKSKMLLQNDESDLNFPFSSPANDNNKWITSQDIQPSLINPQLLANSTAVTP